MPPGEQPVQQAVRLTGYRRPDRPDYSRSTARRTGRRPATRVRTCTASTSSATGRSRSRPGRLRQPPGQPVQRTVATPGGGQARPPGPARGPRSYRGDQVAVHRLTGAGVGRPPRVPRTHAARGHRAAAPTPAAAGGRRAVAGAGRSRCRPSGPDPGRHQPVRALGSGGVSGPARRRPAAVSPRRTPGAPSLPEPAVTARARARRVSRVPRSAHVVEPGRSRRAAERGHRDRRPAALLRACRPREPAAQPSLPAHAARTSTYDAAPSGPGPTAGPRSRSLPLQRMFSGAASRPRAVDLPLRSSVPSATTAPRTVGRPRRGSVSAAVTWRGRRSPTSSGPRPETRTSAAAATSPDAAAPSAAGVAPRWRRPRPPPAKPGGQRPRRARATALRAAVRDAARRVVAGP